MPSGTLRFYIRARQAQEMNSENKFIQPDQIKPVNSEVEIINFTADVYPDQKRVKVHFRLSSFQAPPNAAITVFGVEGEELASVDLVNITQPESEITLHIPKSHAGKGECQVELKLFDLQERQAQGNEKGEVKLITKKLTSSRTAFTLQ